MGAFTPAAAAGVASGVIATWHGTLANIPSGWVLCDGTNSTPDLRDKFVRGAAAAANPGATGGTTTHAHTNTNDVTGTVVGGISHETKIDDADHLPPYYAVAYIMKT